MHNAQASQGRYNIYLFIYVTEIFVVKKLHYTNVNRERLRRDTISFNTHELENEGGFVHILCVH